MEATLNALRGGRDVLQGMSNAAAGAVSVPVDVLAWALRKAGVPVGGEPVGGSDWMKRKGLTREPENRVAGVIGESIGGVLPMVASAKAPQIAAGVNQMIDNAMAPRRMNPQAGAIVWHGSPHKFTRFDSSKIGTGEGAQAYGQGMYVAESPEVAKIYKDTLAYKSFDVGPEAAARGIPLSAGARGEFIRQAQANLDPAIAARNLQNANISARSLPTEKLIDLFAAYKKDGGGNLYKIDLPDEAIGRMLDWDVPFSRQVPEVRNALQNAGVVGRDDWLISGMRGSEAYKRASFGAPSKLPLNQADDQIYASERLRQAGIPGIRYLDQGSRAAGQGTSNYVVFPGNEDLLKILEINDQPVQAVIDALRNKR